MSNSIPLTDVTVRCSPLVREPLSEGQSVDLAAVFKALADPVRLRLFSLIASHEGGEACVCDISPAVDVSQPTISHHLKVLKTAGLLDGDFANTVVAFVLGGGSGAALTGGFSKGGTV